MLVAEDDPRTMRSLTFLLQRHGYEVIAVADGQAALEILLAPNPPALALLDREMPRLDGLHVARAVLKLEQRLAARVAELEQLVEELRQVKRLLPIGRYCRKVRDDGNYWQEIEAYLHQHTGSDFSHGICPQCLETVVEREMPRAPVARRELRGN